jgi:hypothetical protein
MPTKRFDWFIVLAMLPGMSFVGLLAYVAGFDGWGAWGAAPLLLVPVFLSLPITGAGLMRWRRARARGESGVVSALLTLTAAIPLLWLGWRLIVS